MKKLIALYSVLALVTTAAISLGLLRPVLAHSEADAISQVYVFKSLEDDSRLVVIGLIGESLAPEATASFNPEHLYQFNFDTNSDGIEDRVVQMTFNESGGSQTVSIAGPSIPEQTGERIRLVDVPQIRGTVSKTTSPLIISQTGQSIRGFAGLRDDPRDGKDFAGKNILAIAIEVPLIDILAEKKSSVDVWISSYDQETQP